MDYRTHSTAPKGVAVIEGSTVTIVLSMIAVTLRFKSRCMSHSVGADDWAILLGLFFAFCLYIISVLLATIGGLGYEQSGLSDRQLETFLLCIYVDNIIYAICLPTIKVSILLLYRRIFPTRSFRIASLLVGLLVLSWMIATLTVQIFSCKPIEASWKPALARYCIDTKKFYYGNAISNLLTDVIILCLPMPLIWRLNMSKERKFLLSGVFLLGSFVCVCSILRIVYLGRIDPLNATFTIGLPGVWTNAETGIGVVCACLPTLANLWRSWRHSAGELFSKFSRLSSGIDPPPASAGSSTRQRMRHGDENIRKEEIEAAGRHPPWHDSGRKYGQADSVDLVSLQPKVSQDLAINGHQPLH